MGGKTKGPANNKLSDEAKAAEKAAKALAKAQVDFLKAAKEGDCAKIEKGLAAGVDIDYVNFKGQAAAHIAAAFGHRKLLKLLHAKGADFTLQTTDHKKFTPLAAAQTIGEEEAAKLIEALLAGTETAVDMGSDSDDDDDDGVSSVSASGQLVAASTKGRRTEQVRPHGPPNHQGADDTEEAESIDTAQIDTSACIAERSDAIDKSASDGRSYRFLRLVNQLQVMLVSDPSCDYASAAMDVGVGSSSDPEGLPGLAHFCEHMLFLGTAKYPREDEYLAYLEQHGGESNAFTAHEHTHYFFDVQHQSLRGALDRFAQFFIAPLFTADATERELSAIDSEFAKNRQNDAWRLQQLTRLSADPRHPWSRFNAGTRETLSNRPACDGVQLTISPSNSAVKGASGGSHATLEIAPRISAAVDVRQALLAFHQEHYSANLMSLCVLGRGSLDKLQALVAPLFAAVPNHDLPRPSWPHPPFPDARLGYHLSMVAVKESAFLTVTWPLPPIQHLYRTKPFRYVSHILGHEGEGSLLSLLKKRGWAEELMAGETQSHSDFATFEVTVTLTDPGHARVGEIVPLIFSCLRMIAQTQPPPKWVFDEMAHVSSMRLRFQDTVEPAMAALHITQAMQQGVPPPHVLTSSFLYDEWAPSQIDQLLGQLTPKRACLVHVSPKHERTATRREPWYGTAYSVAPISEALLRACASPPVPPELRWPDPNPFIPTEFGLLCAEGDAAAHVDVTDGRGAASTAQQAAADGVDSAAAAVLDAALASRGELPPPRLLTDDSKCELWHKIDCTFRRPKTNFFVDVVAPAAYTSPADAILTALCLRLLNDELSEFAYPAEVAGLSYSVKRHTTGFYLTASGHSHKMGLLLERVLARVAKPSLGVGPFEVQRQLELRALKSFFRAPPREHAKYAATHLLERRRWHVLEYVAFLSNDNECTHARLLALHAALISRARLTAFCHGNSTRAAALEMTAEAVRTLCGSTPLSPDELPDPRCLQLPEGTEVVLRSHRSLHREEHAKWFDGEETNSAVELVLQGELDERPASQMVELLSSILSGPAFEQLRTNEQLGYLVELGVRYDHGVYGLRVAVQSSEHDPIYLEARIEAFLANVPERLRSLSPEAFANHRDALVKRRLEPPKTLRDETSLHWSEITSGTYDFERDAMVARAAAEITQDDLLKYWMLRFDSGAACRRKLTSHAYAPNRELPPKSEGGAVGERRRVYVDSLEEALAFKRTLQPFPPPPKQSKGAAVSTGTGAAVP